MPAQRSVAAAHGAYWAATGAVPLASRRAFEAVVGRKREWWLVQTVAGLVVSIGTGLLSAAARDRVTPELRLVAAGGASVLLAVDVAYAGRGRIERAFLADAAVEAALLCGWLRARDGGPPPEPV